MNWQVYVKTYTDKMGRHKEFRRWVISGVWEFVREDNLRTAHHTEWPAGGPGSKRDAVEGSMRLADKYIPLGAKLPKGMRSRQDPLYNPLLDLEEKETEDA